MDRHNYFNILDFGASKIRFSVFDNELNIKYSESKPVKIEDSYLNHLEIFNSIIKNAEKKISKHIEDIVVILDTTNLFIIEFSLNKDLNSRTKLNTVYESLILELNQIINSFYEEYEIIHTIMDKCIIDKKIYNQLPTDINQIDNIKVDFKLICYPKNLLNNLKKIFNKNSINITNFFCTSYVKSLSYLKKLNIQNISFMEIGLNKTCFLSYKQNKLKIIQMIPIGGIHITKDISKIFKITFEEAEKIKRSFNRSETEFSYKNQEQKFNFSAKDILSKNISIDLLKKVILYRVQEIIDLTFKKSNNNFDDLGFKDSDLFFIGEGSSLFNNNSFHLQDKFEFKSLNFYDETDDQVCNSGLIYYLNNIEIPKVSNKKQGLFEKFFNYFSN